MSPKDRTITVRVEPTIAEQMEAIQERFGMAKSEQIRRALESWLAAGAGGLLGSEKTATRRAPTRRKA